MPRHSALILAAALATPASGGEARFDWFSYEGSDGLPSPAPGRYRNPVLAGFYPDPSITRVGNDFYLVNSTFSWFPGIPVLHSRDLVNWRQIGNAIDRPGQLDFARLGLSRGVFAPTIEYHDGLFLIANTCVDCGGNFIMTARDPAGPWSDPVWLRDVEGIDPSLFFDDDGSAWIVNNRAPPGRPRYDGHRAIWLQRLDPKTWQTSGAPRLLVDGGVTPDEKPVWIEGPHLFKEGGRYYLSTAEGGTSIDHRQVIFRADRLSDPFVPAPPGINPVLTQRDLDPARPAPITSAGHADLVKLADGRWWAVFLATRPYAGNLYNTGRETFLLPVSWQGGWPKILPAGQAIPLDVPAPLPRPSLPAGLPLTGSFAVREEFAGTRLPRDWMWMRSPATPPWRLDAGALLLAPRAAGIGDHGHPAFVARRLQHARATVTTLVSFHPVGGEAAGLAAVQDDDWFLTLALTRSGGRRVVQVRRRAGPGDPAAGVAVVSVPLPAGRGQVQLRMTIDGGRADFAYAFRPGAWLTIATGVDATVLSTERAGGFTGAMVGPFAQRDRPPR